MKYNWEIKKIVERKSSTDKSVFSESEIPDLNNIKPFEFEPKANIIYRNSSSSDDEEGVEDKVKRIVNSVLRVQ